MNFIDKALEKNLRGDDFLQVMSGIYSEPEVRDELDKYPEFIKDVIRIIDYDTTLQMEGLSEVISAAPKEDIENLISALERCGATTEAETLEKAASMPEEEFGEKHDELYASLAVINDCEGFWRLVTSYIDDSLE